MGNLSRQTGCYDKSNQVQIQALCLPFRTSGLTGKVYAQCRLRFHGVGDSFMTVTLKKGKRSYKTEGGRMNKEHQFRVGNEND